MATGQGLLGDLFAFIDRNKETVKKRGIGGLLGDAMQSLNDAGAYHSANTTPDPLSIFTQPKDIINHPASQAAMNFMGGNWTAYHGSPHKFDKFQLDKIGTGEGAQAYGHGLYFADSPEVARQYAEKLGKNGDKPLYKVNIDDARAPKEAFLDWDKPLTASAPQRVKDAFNKIIQERPHLRDDFHKAFREGKPGWYYYSRLMDDTKAGDLVKNQSAATEAMRNAGIPGIRYLDAGSRGGGGTHNTVLFDDSLVKILERQ